jgi:hypothetical protein
MAPCSSRPRGGTRTGSAWGLDQRAKAESVEEFAFERGGQAHKAHWRLRMGPRGGQTVCGCWGAHQSTFARLRPALLLCVNRKQRAADVKFCVASPRHYLLWGFVTKQIFVLVLLAVSGIATGCEKPDPPDIVEKRETIRRLRGQPWDYDTCLAYQTAGLDVCRYDRNIGYDKDGPYDSIGNRMSRSCDEWLDRIASYCPTLK